MCLLYRYIHRTLNMILQVNMMVDRNYESNALKDITLYFCVASHMLGICKSQSSRMIVE